MRAVQTVGFAEPVTIIRTRDRETWDEWHGTFAGHTPTGVCVVDGVQEVFVPWSDPNRWVEDFMGRPIAPCVNDDAVTGELPEAE